MSKEEWLGVGEEALEVAEEAPEGAHGVLEAKQEVAPGEPVNETKRLEKLSK